MQTIKIDIYISDLLYSYDCVVIPDFGGFVANYASAKIQAVQHKISPPSKQISFNKNLKNNDGLLSNHIAERRAISYEEANNLIRSFVCNSIEGLEKGDKIHIEKVGTLFLDVERNVQFTAEDQNDYLLDSFGLGALRVQPIKREGAKERIEKEIQKTIPLIQSEEKKKRKYYWPAAAFLILLLSSSLLLNNQYKWVDANYSSFSWANEETGIYKARDTQMELESFSFNKQDLVIDEGIVAYQISETESTNIIVDNRSEEEKVRIDNTAVANSTLNKSLKFHVMGGCFSQLNNAEGLVNRLSDNGYNARLLGTYKNLYAVSFGSFASREEAIALLVAVKASENPDAWLLVKPF